MSKDKILLKTRSGRLATRLSLTSETNKTKNVKSAPKKTTDNETATRSTRNKQQEKEQPKTRKPVENKVQSAKPAARKSKRLKNREVTENDKEQLLEAPKKTLNTKNDNLQEENVDKTADNRSTSGARSSRRNVIPKNQQTKVGNTSKQQNLNSNSIKINKKKDETVNADSSNDNLQKSKAIQTNTRKSAPTPLKVQTNRRSSRISFTKFTAIGTSTPVANTSINMKKRSSLNLKLSTEKISPISQSKTEAKRKIKLISPVKNIVHQTNLSILKNATKQPIYMKQSINSDISPRKQVQCNTNAKSLRPRRPNKHYQDFLSSQSSLNDEDSEDEEEDNEKPGENKIKDVYEFDADSCEKCSSDSDNDYDKEMIEEMAMIKKLEMKKSKKKIATKAKTKNEGKTNVGVEDIGNRKQKTVMEPKKINVKENMQLNLSVQKMQNKDVSEVPEVEMIVVHENRLEKPELVGEGLITSLVDSFMRPDDDFLMDWSEKKQMKSTFKKPQTAVSPANFRRPSCSRSNLIYRNGPYFIQTKGDSLPAFNQDIVMNSTVVDSHERNFNCRLSAILPSGNKSPDVAVSAPQNVDAKLKTKQTTILKFIGKESQEDEMNCTLFDENFLLSPVKTSSPMVKVDSPSMKPDRNRVLRDLTNLRLRSSVNYTPQREPSDVEFFALGDSGIRAGPGKPMRFLIKSPKKNMNLPKEAEDEEVVKGVDQTAMKEEQDEPSVLDSPVSQTKDDPEGLDAEDSNCKQDVVGIFEDFGGLEVTRTELPSFTYAKRRKRVRIMSYSSDNEDDQAAREEMKTKRKKKGEMTKKEKEEFEQWASAFNKLHDELDNHTLEED